MEKKLQWDKINGDPRVDKYKWEFLRRNDEFRKDYAAFASRFPERIADYGGLIPFASIEEAKAPVSEPYLAASEAITSQWWVTNPINPDLSSDAAEVPPDDEPPSFYRPYYIESGEMWVVKESYPSSPPETSNDFRFLQLRIDITQPTDVIIAEMEWWLENARSRYRFHIGPLPDYRKAPRARFEEYEGYLKVWDLREEGLTFEQIAVRLFPREMKNLANRATVTKRVRAQFQRAQKLIGGEYRQIVG